MNLNIIILVEDPKKLVRAFESVQNGFQGHLSRFRVANPLKLFCIEPIHQLSFVYVRRLESTGRDGFKPEAIGLSHRWILSLNPYQIHRPRAEIRWVALRLFGADVPKRASCRAGFAELATATVFPHPAADAEIDIGENVVEGCVFVVVQTNVNPLARRKNITRTATDGEVMQEALVHFKVRK
jgi:hypothetical protein